MACNELYQYSLALSLMDGVADKGIPISEYLKHGDHGLGTFRYMNGEMIVLDGKAYQMLADGSIVDLDPNGDAIHPFAQITRFQAEKTAKAVVPSKEELNDIVSGIVPDSKNHFLAMRLEGTFKTVTVRTAAGQTEPRQSLREIGRDQVSFTFENVRGTLVGFRQPHYLQGVGIAGDHLHFITEDRKKGGHVLALESDGEVEVKAAQMYTMTLELPKGDEEFNEATLMGSHTDLKAVEG
ncbi:Alpha-acetolactate decarboxylase [Cytospora mali]|uniref:Alpha-acetolactate decarboxylase n=1 Tax=Cytospora mali TaxID=578113 RepID=A0A194VMA3_CYTMA|nr:Alpha-acetolactate decarboxylase [Valsa mali]